MFFDMHVHAYLYPGPPQDEQTQFANPAQIVEMYDAHNIECGILMPLIWIQEASPTRQRRISPLGSHGIKITASRE